MKGPIPLPTSIASGNSMPSAFYMPSHMNQFLNMSQPCTVNLPPPYHKSGTSVYLGADTLDSFSSPMDSLDRLSITEYPRGKLMKHST